MLSMHATGIMKRMGATVMSLMLDFISPKGNAKERESKKSAWLPKKIRRVMPEHKRDA